MNIVAVKNGFFDTGVDNAFAAVAQFYIFRPHDDNRIFCRIEMRSRIRQRHLFAEYFNVGFSVFVRKDGAVYKVRLSDKTGNKARYGIFVNIFRTSRLHELALVHKNYIVGY